MDQPLPPLGDIIKTRQQFDHDTTNEFKHVVEDGAMRRSLGQPLALPYKGTTDPENALRLAMVEWETRRLIQERNSSSSRSHLMHDVKRLGSSHYEVSTTPWGDPLQPIKELCELALRISRTELGAVTLEASMNRIIVRARWNSKPGHLTRDWRRANKDYIKGPIGPKVPDFLSEEELRQDARIMQADRSYQKLKKAIYTAKLQEDQRQLDAALDGLPEMEIGDAHQERMWQEAVEHLEGSESKAAQLVINFGKTWARLMQAEMAAGKQLEEIISSTYRLAHGSIAGLMGSEVGAVLYYVAETWVHRDTFKRHTHLISTLHHVA